MSHALRCCGRSAGDIRAKLTARSPLSSPKCAAETLRGGDEPCGFFTGPNICSSLRAVLVGSPRGAHNPNAVGSERARAEGSTDMGKRKSRAKGPVRVRKHMRGAWRVALFMCRAKRIWAANALAGWVRHLTKARNPQTGEEKDAHRIRMSALRSLEDCPLQD